MSEIVGYARVSTVGQSLDVQEEKLDKAGCTQVFMEKRSGRQMETRIELQKVLAYVRAGDQLVITKLDRMARSVLDLAKIMELLNKKKVALRVLDQSLNTSTSEGKLMFSLLGAFAEFENDIRRERQFDGIAKAKQKGITFGRKAALTDDQKATIRRLREHEAFTVPQLASKYHVGVATIYRALAGFDTDEVHSSLAEASV